MVTTYTADWSVYRFMGVVHSQPEQFSIVLEPQKPTS